MEKLWYYRKIYGSMVKNCGTVEKKLWYYTNNYGTLIYEGKKNMVDYQKLWNFDLELKKKLWLYTKTIEVFEQIWSLKTYYRKTMVLWKKLWYYVENYGSNKLQLTIVFFWFYP